MKTAIQSKTIIFGALIVVLSILNIIVKFLPTGNISDLITAIIGVIVIILRFKTTTPIKGIM